MIGALLAYRMKQADQVDNSFDLTASTGGVAPTTNLSYVAGVSAGTVVSDTGTDAVIPLADGTNAGLLSAAEKAKIAALGSAANSATTDFATAAQGAQAASALQPGANLSQAAVAAATAAGVTFLRTYRGAFSGRPTSPADGDIAYFTDVCFPPGGARFRYVTSLGFWVPDGTQTIFVNNGTLTTPVSSVAGVTAGNFALTNNTLPAGLLQPGMRGSAKAFIRRTGATATGTFAVYLGTTGTISDSQLAGLSLPATTATEGRYDCPFYVANSGVIVTYANVGVNASSATTSVAERTTNINTAAGMSFTCAISLANVADSFALNQLVVELSF